MQLQGLQNDLLNSQPFQAIQAGSKKMCPSQETTVHILSELRSQEVRWKGSTLAHYCWVVSWQSTKFMSPF